MLFKLSEKSDAPVFGTPRASFCKAFFSGSLRFVGFQGNALSAEQGSAQRDERLLARARPDWSKRIPALDGVRGIAILLVLLRHSIFGMESAIGGPRATGFFAWFLAAGQLTWSGVDLFFVLSGFLIGGILLDARNSPRYFQTFYFRRLYRILPLYFVVVAMFLSQHLPWFALIAKAGRFQPLEIPWWAYATFTQNFWMAYLGTFGLNSAGLTWSLAIEEQFYLTIPWIIRKVRPRFLSALLVAVVIGAPLVRLALRSLFGDHGGIACYVLTPARADGLSLGVLCALLVRRERVWDWLVARKRSLWLAFGLLFCGVTFMTWRQFDAFSDAMTSWGYSWLALLYAGFLLLAVVDTGGWLERSLRNPVLTRLGTLAYCLYLIHISVMQSVRHPLSSWLRGSPHLAWILGGIIGAGASVMLASLSWKYFEKPLLRRGHRYQY
jgi:peptidoglycan/LPS O-acetylase OafA/YrhL